MPKLLFIIRNIGLILVLGVLGACDMGGGSVGMGGSTAEVAEKVAAKFYQAVIAKDYAAAAGMFVDAESGARAIDQLQLNLVKLGDLQSYELRDTTVNTVFSGRRFTLKYVVKYARFSATERLIMFENVSEPGIRIEVYSVVSEGLRR